MTAARSGFFRFSLAPTEIYPRAKAVAIKALELDDQLAEAHTSLDRILFGRPCFISPYWLSLAVRNFTEISLPPTESA